MNDRFLCFRTTPSQPLGRLLHWKLPFSSLFGHFVRTGYVAQSA